MLYGNLPYNLSIIYRNKVLNCYISYLIRILPMLSEYIRHLVLKYSTSTLPILHVYFPHYILFYVTLTYKFHTECSYTPYGTRILYRHTLRIPYILYGNKVLIFYVSYLIRILPMLNENTRYLVLKYSPSTLPTLSVCYPRYILFYVTSTYDFHTECSYMTYGTIILYNHTLRIPCVYSQYYVIFLVTRTYVNCIELYGILGTIIQ